MSKRHIIFNSILIVLAVAGLFLYLFLGSVSVKFENEKIVIKGTLTQDANIKYADVDELLLYDSVNKGYPSMMFKNFRVNTGRYSSSQYGPYQLMVHNGVEKYIILKSNDQYVIFNCETEKETKDCYKKLQEAISVFSDPNEDQKAPENTPKPTEEPLVNIGGESPN